MPSAEMRGNTRIFEARVLRSGRRVSTGSRKAKHMKSKEVSEWIDLLDDSGDDGDDAKYKLKGWHKNDGVRRYKDNPMDIDKKSECKLEAVSMNENLIVDRVSAKMFGIVYTRKRKKLNSNMASVSFAGGETIDSVDKRYQRHFVRQRWRKKIKLSNICDSNVALITQEAQFNTFCKALVIVVKPWCSNKSFVSDVLTSSLRYMRSKRIELDQLMGFFLSKTFNNVCSSCGIDFMLGTGGSLPSRGLCIISETGFIPMLYIDFSAVPSCFMYLHSCMQLRFATISLNNKDESILEETDDTDDNMITTMVCDPVEKDQVTDISVPIVTNFIQLTPVLESRSVTRAASKFSGLTMQLRNARRKTSNSLRQKKKSKPPVFRVNSKSPDRRRSSIQFTTRYRSRSVAKRNIRSSVVSQVKSAVVGLNRAIDPMNCIANILITEPDKCYREEGVVITLEVSTGNRCHLAIKKNGVLQYSLVAQKIMKPCTCNRFTRAIILNIENGWKLEFTDRLQWSVFKELYKKCSDQNIQIPLESSIPIPGVTEVPIDLNNNNYFVRPVSYINVKSDELTRALTSKVSNYDIDSEDGEWLKKFNADNISEDESFNLLSDEDFELIIDGFERGFHFNPDDYNDENTVPSISVNVVPRIVEAVYVYWFRKRKLKKSALVRVFQLYQPRKSQFIPRSVLRKKRSFKRQRVPPGQRFLTGRGKPPTLLEAMAVEQVAAREREERRHAVLRVEETKAAAKRSESVAVVKRHRAQQLMENADLATYKAVMALRIAELAQIAAESAASADADGDAGSS